MFILAIVGILIMEYDIVFPKHRKICFKNKLTGVLIKKYEIELTKHRKICSKIVDDYDFISG